MPTPAYITALRAHVGHTLLILPGVSGAVITGEPGAERVLLGRRADNDEWELPSGIVEPDEEPATGLEREVLEETGVVATADRLVLLSTDDVTYPNGDRCRFISMTFRCTYVSGDAHVADEESTDVRWFALDDLPPLSARHQQRLACALAEPGPTPFER
jgi:8-oxo-dGTP pyrophosphatase MutT (NUDIX family)